MSYNVSARMISFDLSAHPSPLCFVRVVFSAIVERICGTVLVPLRTWAIVLGIMFSCLWPLGANAQQSAKRFEVETTWPGVHYKLVKIERILDERLLMVVLISATSKAPAKGTFIGVRPSVPANATVEERRSGRYEARPFSLASSVMIDDQTSQKFSALAPVAPPGKDYASAQVFANLMPGRAEIMTLQFKVPPTSLNQTAEESPEKPTVSLLLTNAKAPITGIPIPFSGAEDLAAQRK